MVLIVDITLDISGSYSSCTENHEIQLDDELEKPLVCSIICFRSVYEDTFFLQFLMTPEY